MAEYIHGGTDEREVARLEKQARFVAPQLHKYLRAVPGQRVLDLATGVGAMAGELLRRIPGLRLVGLDRSRRQLDVAHRNHPQVSYVHGDATSMPFGDGAFDHVHCSWLLEHVPDPVAVLREVRRVLVRGGEALFIEVDNASFRTTPLIPEAQEMMRMLSEAQQRAGGDPYVGRRLEPLFREAGFSQVEVWPMPQDGHVGEPRVLQPIIDEFAEIFESVDEALGPELKHRLDTAAAKLRALPGIPGASIYYCGFAARATR